MTLNEDPMEIFRSRISLDLPSVNPAQEDTGGNLDFMTAAPASSGRIEESVIQAEKDTPNPVSFPDHLFTPKGATSVDIRKVCTILPNAPTGEMLMSFKAPEGSYTRFIAYGVFCDAQFENKVAFLPLLDGARVFPYHGDPMANYRIALGLGPDLGDPYMIGCQLQLSPGQTIEWWVFNSDTVPVMLGVRMKGYFDTGSKLTTPKFGG